MVSIQNHDFNFDFISLHVKWFWFWFENIFGHWFYWFSFWKSSKSLIT